MRDQLKLSADQCRAILVHLIAQGDVARRHWFEELSEIAAQEDWPSSVTAPYQLLTEREFALIWNGDADARQRVLAPYLTRTQLAELRRSTKQWKEFARQAFGEI
jgi:hypothetical protein